MDDLSTLKARTFYEAFEQTEARGLALRFEFHYALKQGELVEYCWDRASALERPSLAQRFQPSNASRRMEVATQR